MQFATSDGMGIVPTTEHTFDRSGGMDEDQETAAAAHRTADHHLREMHMAEARGAAMEAARHSRLAARWRAAGTSYRDETDQLPRLRAVQPHRTDSQTG